MRRSACLALASPPCQAFNGRRSPCCRGSQPRWRLRTITMAPFGYVNTSLRTEDGREVRMVKVDRDRKKWVKWLFEHYATGEWTIGMLRDEMAEQGVTSLPRPKRVSAPLSYSHIATILKNPYYTGVVTYNGVQYEGRHKSLVSEQLFEACQRVREQRAMSREKPVVRTHYLKGTVFCGQCGSPLSYQRSRGRSGEYYEYFYCMGRQVSKNGCAFVACQTRVVEAAVEDEWGRLELTDTVVGQIREVVFNHLETVLPRRDRRREEAERKLKLLQQEADKVLQAFYADAVSVEMLRAEQARIKAARVSLERILAEAAVQADRLRAALKGVPRCWPMHPGTTSRAMATVEEISTKECSAGSTSRRTRPPAWTSLRSSSIFLMLA